MVAKPQKVPGRSALSALVALTLQNTSLVILLNYTFREGAIPYSPACVVLVTEFVKFTISAVVAVCTSKYDLVRAISARSEQRMLLLPSGLYVIQNNLLFLGAKLLPPVVYIVCTQTKILATALMSRLILGTRVTKRKYISLIWLGVGIVLVQRAQEEKSDTVKGTSLASESIGMVSVFLASLTSGAAGVVLEKIYKAKQDQQEIGTILNGEGDVNYTVWIRNVQLSGISLPIALFSVILQSSESLTWRSIFAGFDEYVWGVVFCQAAGGIITGYVLKFANNIHKCLAVGISICLCAIYSVTVGTLPLSLSLVAGILVVTASVFLYSANTSGILLRRRASESYLVT